MGDIDGNDNGATNIGGLAAMSEVDDRGNATSGGGIFRSVRGAGRGARELATLTQKIEVEFAGICAGGRGKNATRDEDVALCASFREGSVAGCKKTM